MSIKATVFCRNPSQSDPKWRLMTRLLMLVAKSELAFCSRARRLKKPAFAEVLGLTSGCRERLGGRIADFATSINSRVTSRHLVESHQKDRPREWARLTLSSVQSATAASKMVSVARPQSISASTP